MKLLFGFGVGDGVGHTLLRGLIARGRGGGFNLGLMLLDHRAIMQHQPARIGGDQRGDQAADHKAAILREHRDHCASFAPAAPDWT